MDGEQKKIQVMHIGSCSPVIPVSSLHTGAQRTQVTPHTEILSRVAELGISFMSLFRLIPVAFLINSCIYISNIQIHILQFIQLMHLYCSLGKQFFPVLTRCLFLLSAFRLLAFCCNISVSLHTTFSYPF